MVPMGAADWIVLLLLGGLLGMLGQGVRVVGGLKKVHDQASQQGKQFGDLFELSSLVISLLIGFIAGALAVLVLGATQSDAKPVSFDPKTLFALLAAGYAGTDFIEAFMKKYLPGDNATKPKAEPAGEGAPPAVG